MEGFGMELYPPSLFSINAESCRFDIFSASYDTEVLRKISDRITVRHPDDTSRTNTLHEFIMLMLDRQMSTAILTKSARLHLSSCLIDQALGTIADTQQRELTSDCRKIYAKGFAIIHGVRTT